MSTESEDLREAIVESASEGVQSVSVDGMTVTESSLRSRLEVLRDAERRDLSSGTTLPLRLTPIRTKGLQ